MNTLLQWFVTSSVLILAVLALRRLLGGRISPRVKYALWAVVLVWLLVPFQIPTPHPPTAAELTPEPASLTQTTIPLLPATYSMEEVATGQAPNLTFDVQGQLHTDRDIGEVKPSADGQRAVFSLVWLSPAQLLLGLWAMGAVILALVLLGSNLRFFLRLRLRRTPLALDNCPLPVYTVEGLPSPCLFGLFRPCIYLTPGLALDSPTRAHTSAFYLYVGQGGDYVLARLDDSTAGAEPLAVLPEGTTFQLEDLFKTQLGRNQSTTRVEYPEFKNQLTQLFLGVEECVLLNDTEDHPADSHSPGRCCPGQ